MKLALEKIRIDGGTQPREKIDADYVEELAEKIDRIVHPVIVYHDGREYWLADGFHRYLAHGKANKKSIDAKVIKGTVREAILYSVGCNAQHGLRRTNADKRRAVLTLLNDKEWGKKSDRWIAEKCDVGHPLVAEIRKSNGSSSIARESKDGRKGWKSVPNEETEVVEKEEVKEISKETTPAKTEAVEEPLFDTSAPASPPVKTDHTKQKMPIEDMEIISVFNRAADLEDLARKVSDIKSIITRGVGDKDELFAEVNLSAIQADANNLYRQIKGATPHAVCRYCNGRRKSGCRACRGKGWVGMTVFNATPEEMK
jgi:hypothetical protein